MSVQPWESGWLEQWRRVATTRRHADVHEARVLVKFYLKFFARGTSSGRHADLRHESPV